jgi:DNA polymerase-3 subunit delta'
MSWQGIEGHDAVVEMFRQSLARGRLASTYLFTGPSGIGKRTFALKLAQALFCETNPPEKLHPCGHCPSCVQVEAGTHPDLLQVAKPADKNEIPVHLVIGSQERRMQEGLCHDLWLKPSQGSRRIAIIDDADHLNEEGANALLKTLEEPPPRAVIMLIGTSVDRQLPTIRSRSQIIRFRPLALDTVARLLLSHELADDAAAAQRMAEHSQGSLSLALELADPELWTFRRQMLAQLSDPAVDTVALGKTVLAFVDAAGKDAGPRRARARQVINFAIELYWQLARALGGAAVAGDRELSEAVARLLPNWKGNEETAAACAERSLEAREHLDRYANQSTLVECWLDDLAGIMSRGYALPTTL